MQRTHRPAAEVLFELALKWPCREIAPLDCLSTCRALDVLSFVPLHPFDCRDSCRVFFHFSSHHTSQTKAAATNPRDIVIAAISLASMGFYLLSDARQFLFEGALTVYDVAEPFV